MRAALIICVTLLPITASAQGARRERPRPTREELRIHQALATKLALDFRNQPLQNVICEIAKLSNVNVHVPPGINLKAPVTYRANGVSASLALAQILSPLGLDFEIRDEVVRIRRLALLVSKQNASRQGKTTHSGIGTAVLRDFYRHVCSQPFRQFPAERDDQKRRQRTQEERQQKPEQSTVVFGLGQARIDQCQGAPAHGITGAFDARTGQQQCRHGVFLRFISAVT